MPGISPGKRPPGPALSSKGAEQAALARGSDRDEFFDHSAVRLAKGEKTRANATVNNGKPDVPAILLTPVLVTNENIKTTVVKDGFQTLKRINEGLPKDQQIN